MYSDNNFYSEIFFSGIIWRGNETDVNLYSINSILYDVKYYSIILLL